MLTTFCRSYGDLRSVAGDCSASFIGKMVRLTLKGLLAHNIVL